MTKEAEIMTNEQFEGILNMIMQILEGCDDLATAKKRIKNVYPGKHGGSNGDKTTKDTKDKTIL